LSRLSANTVTLAVSNVGTALLSFLLAVLIGRGLGESGLGAYAVALAWVMPLSLLAEFGIGTLITRELAKQLVALTPRSLESLAASPKRGVPLRKGSINTEHVLEKGNGVLASLPPSTAGEFEMKEQGSLVQTAVQARLLMGGGLMLLLILAAPLLTNDAALALGIQLSAPLILIQPLYSTYTAIFRARGDMRPIPWLNIGMLAVQVGLTAAVLVQSSFQPSAISFQPIPNTQYLPVNPQPSVLSPQSYLLVIAVNTLTSAAQLAACWLWYRRRHYAPATGERQPLRPLLRAAWHFGLAALFAAVQVRLSTIMLEQYTGLSEAGFYAGANRFVEAARLLPNAFFGAAFPALTALAANPDGMRATLRRAGLLMGGYGVLAAVCLALLAVPLLALAYGESFTAAAPALALLGASLVFSLLRGLRTLYWYAHGREAFVNAVNAGVIALQLALGVWLIPQHGAAGAALVMLAAEAAGLAALLTQRG
jgi:O-antigen/teichoic acid export membrane protein